MPDKFAMYLVVPSFRFYVGLGRLVMKEVDAVALLPHHLLPSLAPKITISLRYHLFQRLVLSPLKLSGTHQPIEVYNCIHSHIVTSHFSLEWAHISSNLQIIMAFFAAFIINKLCLTGMFNQMLLPIEQYLNHSHTPTPFNLSYSPNPFILRPTLPWMAGWSPFATSSPPCCGLRWSDPHLCPMPRWSATGCVTTDGALASGAWFANRFGVIWKNPGVVVDK